MTLRDHIHVFLAGLVFGATAMVAALSTKVGLELSGDGLGVSDPNSATLISGFGGAVIGAVVGGLISWLLARQAAGESRRRDSEQRFEADRAAAIRTMLKVQMITNGTYTIAKSLRNDAAVAVERGAALWEVVKPHIGSKVDIKIQAEDLSPFWDAAGNEFADSITLSSLRYDVLEETLADYSSRRARLGDLLATFNPEIDMETGSGNTQIPPGQIGVVKARVFELTDTLRQMQAFAEADLVANLKLCDQMTVYGVNKFGSFPKLVTLPDLE